MQQQHMRKILFLTACSALALYPFFLPRPLFAQDVTNPNSKELFKADSSAQQNADEQRRKKVLAIEKENNPEVDVKASNVEFFREPQRVKGSGGVVVSRAGVSVQADESLVNMDTKDSNLQGNLWISGMGAEIGGENGDFNLESETGEFRNAEVFMDQGSYHFVGNKVNKTSEFSYEFFDARLTTCGCTDGEAPWHIDADSIDATQEGYAQAYNATFSMYGVPFFYTPFIAFPVKTERASGLLTPSFGVSRQDGVQFMQPIFGVIDDSTDVLLTPFFYSQSRVGSKFDFRQSYSQYSQIDSRFIYSNESARGNNTRGSIISNLDQSKSLIDTNRFGAYISQSMRGEKGALIPWAMASDIHYVSDDLMMRELQDPKLGPFDSRFATSTVGVSGSFGEYVNASVGGEYNQSLIDPDDGVLQRLPTLNVGAQKSFRPFGFNPYGVKLTASNVINSVDFHRETGFDGWRHDISPTLSIPFHYQNYFDSTLSATSHQTFYQMSDSLNPSTGEDFDYNTNRSVYQFSYQTQTAVERVYDLDPGNSLTWLTSLGSGSQINRLERVKHTIEPFVNFSYVPQEFQGNNPLYDSLDRINTRRLVTYGFRTSLVGRFLPPGGIGDKEIPELTPRAQDLPLFSQTDGLPEFGNDHIFGAGGNVSTRRGEVRDIIYLTMRQSYDRYEALYNKDPNRAALSDVYSEVGVSPTRYLTFIGRSNYDVVDTAPSSWDIGTQFTDDRGDALTLRYNYTTAPPGQDKASLNQLEGNLELVLAEQLRFGYYGRYDEVKREFQVNKFALRFSDSCKCWTFDVGMMQQINPDRQWATVSLTLQGLGDVTQKFGLDAGGTTGTP